MEEKRKQFLESIYKFTFVDLDAFVIEIRKILTQVSSVEIFEFTALSHVTVCASVNRERRKPFINLFCT